MASSNTIVVSHSHGALESVRENKENTTLIWCDPKIGKYQDTYLTMKRLREINDYVAFHTEIESCVAYIESIQNENIFLIISGSYATHILPRIVPLCQIDSIFIFCYKKDRYDHLTNEYSKIVGVYVDLDSLRASIQNQIDLVEKQLEAFSFFDQNQQSMRDLDKESAAFLWFHIFNHVLLRFPRNAEAKKEMLDSCRRYYRDNPKQQKLIDDFEHEYHATDAIKWYSKHSFVYKLINKALRSEDIDQLHTFRLFIGDLSQSLADQHHKMILTGERTLTVYRGAKIWSNEFDKFKNKEGKLVSNKGFFSTSRRRSLALDFATKPTKRTDVVPVLFEIECNVQQLGDKVVFADIMKLSEFPAEQEVLFGLGATFRLKGFQYDGQVYLVKMSASSAGQDIIKAYIDETHQEMEDTSVAIVYGRLMSNMGQYDKSEKYFKYLLKDPNGEDQAWIEHNIGRALHYKGDLDAARQYYDRAYARMMNAKPPRIKDSAATLRNIGGILRDQGKYDEALRFHQRSLEIKETYYPAGHVDIAQSLRNIGLVYLDKGDPDSALEYFEKSVQMKEKCLPPDHPSTARSIDNLGAAYDKIGNYKLGLKYKLKSLRMREKSLPPNHSDIGRSLNNIGLSYANLSQPETALDYYTRALAIYEKSLAIGHPDRVKIEQNILHLSGKK